MKIIITVFLLFIFSQSFGQNKKSCDSLVNKSYAFLYNEADYMFLGKILDVTARNEFSKYLIVPSQTFKGTEKKIYLTQNANKQFFSFQADSSFVFLVFNNYSDPVFSPCILFGKKDKMIGLTEYAKSKCVKSKIIIDESNTSNGMRITGSCEKIYDPVCGCDGQEYGNPCEAEKAGIVSYSFGPCLK